MRLALEVWGNDEVQILVTARRAEALGIDAFYYGESPNGLNLDCWSMLAALATATERIRLGPVITNLLPDHRHPLLAAKQAATVARLSAGRLDFRTGVGADTTYGRAWWEPYGVRYGRYSERLAQVERTLSVLRPYWAGDPVMAGDLGPNTSVARSSVPQPVVLGFDCPAIPITVAATGRKGLALAARLADVWESSFCTPAAFTALRTRFERLATDHAGAPISYSLEIDAALGTTSASASAAVTRFASDRADEDVGALRTRALLGEPEAAAERIAELAEAGVEQLVVAAHDPHDPDGLEALVAARSAAGL